MNPFKPSRRSLIGGLIAGLFGWLSAADSGAQTQGSRTVPVPDTPTPLPTGLGSITTCSYDADGFSTYAGSCRRESVTVSTYDAQGRLTSTTDR